MSRQLMKLPEGVIVVDQKMRRAYRKRTYKRDFGAYNADSRGYFYEVYNIEEFYEYGISDSFVQDNEVESQYGVFRGLHFQRDPWAQAKLVRVSVGSVFDVIVDLRVGYSSFGCWFGITLSDENKLQMYIPEGFAHGYVSLTPYTIFHYKVDQFWNEDMECGIIYDDPILGITLPIAKEKLIISPKDREWPQFASLLQGGMPFGDREEENKT